MHAIGSEVTTTADRVSKLTSAAGGDQRGWWNRAAWLSSLHEKEGSLTLNHETSSSPGTAHAGVKRRNMEKLESETSVFGQY